MGIVIPKKWQNLVAVMVEHYEVRDSSLVFFGFLPAQQFSILV